MLSRQSRSRCFLIPANNMRVLNLILFSYFLGCSTAGVLDDGPSRLQLRQSSSTSVLAPPIDLGYGIYQGYYNATSQLNIYKGSVYFSQISIVFNQRLLLTLLSVRYAAPPTGTLRWQKPQPPAVNRSQTILATAFPPRCPQGNDAPLWIYLQDYLKGKVN